MKNLGNYKLLSLTVAISAAFSSYQASAAQEVGGNTADESVEVIQVTGIRSSLTEAMELKKNASSIQDSIVAEDIGKFPDQNVAESLQRIPGVMISRTNGEGTAITVRGLGPKFNAVKLNNRTIATSERGREFDFQILPSELISGADIIKASRANIAEGGIGAYVTVNTAKPLNSPGEHIAGSVNVKYNDLAEETSPQFSGIYSNTFNDDSFGILLGFSYVESTNRIDAHEGVFWDKFVVGDNQRAPGPVEYEDGSAVADGQTVWYPGRAQFMTDEEERERTSANITLQWAPTSEVTHTIDSFYTDFDRSAFSNGMQAPLHRDGFTDVVVSRNNTVLAATKNSDPLDGLFQTRAEASQTFALGYNVMVLRDKWTFAGDVAYSKAESTPQRNWYVPNIVNDGGLTDDDYIKFDSRGTDVINVDSSIAWDDPAGVKAHWNFFSNDVLEDEVTEVKFDANYELDSGIYQSVDIGIAYTDRKKTIDKYDSTDTQCGSTVFTCGTLIDMSDDLFSINTVGNYLSDVSGQFPRDFIFINNINDYVEEMKTISQDPNWGTPVLQPNSSVENTEEILALYAQLNLEGETDSFIWRGNVGMRYVDNESVSNGFAIQVLDISMNDQVTDDGEVIDITLSDPSFTSARNTYSEFLPSANVSLDFSNGWYVKGAAAKVMTRPALEDVGVDMTVGGARLSDYSRSQGNPYLNPYLATQFDLSLEFYQENGSSYSANLFYKDFSSWISTQTFVQDTEFMVDRNFDGIDETVVEETVTQKSNRSGVKLSGIELAALHYFDYLPGWMSGFGVQANYTYTDSSDSDADIFDQPGVTSPGSGVEGFSPNAFNIIGFYENEEFQARLAYNWRESFLIQRQSDIGGGLPKHADDYGQFDFSTSYDLNETFTINMEVINLTDENILEYGDVRERVSLVQYSGRRYQVGVAFKF
ncbi:TonB-dependent receptor [Thalassotalea sp. PLHSN55]|uniref:TonB-dependent receptor n=1 Tax=Thalassotalea sp. PLHSN55 TaxID=3435888 RepID=UPI003F836B9A